jgi:hypothetical protein
LAKEMTEKLLKPQELAEILKVRPGTIYPWISRGVDIPYVKIEGTVRFIRKAGEILLAPSLGHDHGGSRIYPDHIDHIYPDHVPTRDLGNRGLPMRNLSTGAQTIVPLPREGIFSYPFKSPPPLHFDINHWISGVQGQKRTRGQGRSWLLAHPVGTGSLKILNSCWELKNKGVTAPGVTP